MILRRVRSKLTQIMQTVRYGAHGISFVNQILRRLGRGEVTEATYHRLVAELQEDSRLTQAYEARIELLQETSGKPIHSWRERFEYGKGRGLANVNIFYVLPRVLRPRMVVETGVASGSTTSFLLAALAQNRHGQLCSIDLPPMGPSTGMDWSLPPGMEVGFLVPTEYRERWQLIKGDATYELPQLLRDLGSLDYFIHDSLHTYSHMMFEFSVALKHVADSGIIVSDDVRANTSFFDFFETLGYPIFLNKRNTNIGVALVVPPDK